MTETKRAWTVEQLEWLPWVETVQRETATPEQLAVIQESSPSGAASPYYELLAHDPAVLRERSRLFKAVMYGGQGGLSRAERELATVAVSRINGCVYCASVHGRLFGQLTKQPDVIQHIFDDGDRRRARRAASRAGRFRRRVDARSGRRNGRRPRAAATGRFFRP